jgi:cysteine desulfurase
MAMFSDQARAESIIRISLSYQNEPEEATKAIESIRKTVNKLQKVMG